MEYVIPYRVPDDGMKVIEQVIARHHRAQSLAPSGSIVLFTSLIGSQNYGLEGPNSDIDTYSFIIPPLPKLISLEKPISLEEDLGADGKIVVKDYRLAFDSLHKSNPSAIEWFYTRYMCIDVRFKSVFDRYFQWLEDMVHCDPKHMANALLGHANQIMQRENMPLGKRYANMLRLTNLATCYYANKVSHAFPLPLSILTKARAGKFGEINDDVMKETMNIVLRRLQDLHDTYQPTEVDERLAFTANHRVDGFEEMLFHHYYKLMELN